jgi:hypothetical protein
LNGILYCGHCGKRMTSGVRPLDSSGDTLYCCSTYNQQGIEGCFRNSIHQAAILPFLIRKIQELLQAKPNRDRLRIALATKVKGKRSTGSGNLGRMRTRLEKLDQEIKQAAAELKRTPDDLYDLAVADLRELREQRTALAGELSTADAGTLTRSRTVDAEVEKAMRAAERLQESLNAADPALVREALSRVCERIDLWFTHKRGKVLTKSTFSRGIAKFRGSSLSIQANRLC